jgi:hypothetical protein
MTFEELKSSVGSWMGKKESQLSDAIRGQIINIGQRELLRVNNLSFSQTTSPIVLVPNQVYTATPDRWSRPYSFTYANDGETEFVQFITKEEFDKRYPDSLATGDYPEHVTRWGNKLYWGPTPKIAATVVCNYLSYLPDLSDGVPGNTNDLIVYGWEALLFRSLWYSSLFGFEDARAPLWEKMALKFELQLVVEHSHSFRAVTSHPQSKEYGNS